MNGWLPRRWLLDRIVACALLLVLSVVIALLALVVRLTSPGPALLRLPRVGQGGRPFGMWKLRTMRSGPDGRRAGGPALTSADDARVTRVGRFLRRHHLDELPQLLNVIGGEMALIGPRPETPEYVDLADRRWGEVLAMRPGIVGATQVVVHRREAQLLSAGGEDGYRTLLLPTKLAIDAWYGSAASWRVDALIVLAVARDLMSGDGNTRLHRRLHSEVGEAGALLSSSAG